MVGRNLRTYTRNEMEIAKTLGVTCAGLSAMARAVASGGLCPVGGMVAKSLIERGLLDLGGRITAEGEQIVRRARNLGW